MNNILIENSLIRKELCLKSDRIIGWTIKNIVNGKEFSSLDSAEEFILSFKCGLRKILIRASQLKVADVIVDAEASVSKYTVVFKPFSLRDSKLKISLVYLVDDFKCYLRKYIELSYVKKGAKEVIFDSLSFEKFTFESKYKFWTIPKQKNAETKSFPLSLGQPVYVDCFFFGCEFPVAINKIENYTASSTYYSGKKLDDIMLDNVYTSHKSVLGSADSNVYEDVQKAFFEYIKDISKPIYLRRQYNSWYDNMLNITHENISSSFLEVEKQLTRTGEPPLASYVADDGWNDYEGSFWGFNKSFPDELYPFKKLAEGLGSKFGLWLGPRGGYTSDTIRFAHRIQAAGNGYVNRQALDICVGSKKYTEKTTALLMDFQKRFNINYYKLDGFAQFACKNKKHDHTTGGYKSIYFFTDTWERWIKSFESLAEGGGDDFWINLTCYAWPSAWFLQWVNSVWMQISFDVGFTGKKGVVSDKDRMLSYRDELYYDFSHTRQFQFPQRALYNHDPIYGKEAKVSMTDDEFREYLFTMATRGTQFWELYYSHSMMNEAKWRINYSCMRFIEENMDVLSNSVIFGGRASESKVYGFSCFGDDEGIVSLRNSSDKPADYTLRLDEIIGVKKSFSDGAMYQCLPYSTKGMQGAYSYGDTVSFTLEPYQTKIVHFGMKKRELKLTYIKAVAENELLVTFNRSVNIADIVCNENPIVKKELLEDYMSAKFTFEAPFNKDNSYILSYVKDIMCNEYNIAADFRYFEDGIISDDSIKGDGDFSLEINLVEKSEGELYSQGDELKVYIGEDRFVYFKLGSSVMKSDLPATDVVQITAVRERNNVIKLYLNKSLDSGMCTAGFNLTSQEKEIAAGVNVRLLDRALAYDEV